MSTVPAQSPDALATDGPTPSTRGAATTPVAAPASTRWTSGLVTTTLLAATLVIAWFAPVSPETKTAWHVGIVIAAAVVAWAAAIAPDYVVALAVVTILQATGVVPGAAALSGFASPGWFLLLGVLVLSLALTRCGLLERLGGGLLVLFPPTLRGQAVALVVVGLVLTPLVPLTVARCALVAPLAARLARALGCTPGTPGATLLGLAAFLGAGLLGRGILSGAAINVIVWHLLPIPDRPTWTAWLIAALPATAVMLAASLATLFVAFRAGRSAATSDARARGAAPRRITSQEWGTGAIAAVALAGFVLGPRLGLDAPWIACGAAVVLLGSGVLDRQDFRTGLDWALLLFLGVILGVPAVLQHAGLDDHVAAAAVAIVPQAVSPYLTVAALFIATTLARFVLSEWVGAPVLTLAFLPIGAAHGLEPWVVAFVVLVGANAWFVPYQFASYATFLSASQGELFEPRQGLLFCCAWVVISLVAIVASVPFWQALDLIR